MPWFTSTAKAVVRLAAKQRSISKQCIKYSMNNYVQNRWWSSIAGIDSFSLSNKLIDGAQANNRDNLSRFENVCNKSASIVQKRGFLGVGDGDEGNFLSKKYEEKCVLGYSPQQLFDVVAAVDLYEDFLPWCQRSQIIRRNPDGTYDAELEIGFKFLVESYISHVELKKPSYIKTTASESGLFDHLINVWQFNPGPAPGTCDLYFLVDFKFQSPFYHQMANMFFKEVFSRLVGSFNDRCRTIYGPEIPVPGNIYQQKT